SDTTTWPSRLRAPISTRIAVGGTTMINIASLTRAFGARASHLIPIALVAAIALSTPGSAEGQTGGVGAAGRARASGAIRADYDPRNGVRLTSPDGAVELTAPAGALGELATFQQAILPTPVSRRGLRLARAFQLDASTIDG